MQRSPGYVVTQPTRDRRAQALRRRLPAPLADRMIRWKSVVFSVLAFNYARRRPDTMRRLLRRGVVRALGPDYAVDRHFNPGYRPWDQRLCVAADGDFFHAIKAGGARIATDEIATFTSDGVRLTSGETLAADVVVSATGLVIKVFGGMEVIVDGRLIDVAKQLVYRGAMLEDLPNLAFAFGYTNASWTLRCDVTARFVARLLRYMRRHGWTSAVPHAGGRALPREPLSNFTAGYIRRGEHALPRKGPAPWRPAPNYIADVVYSWRPRLNDGVLRFGRVRNARDQRA